MPTYRRRRRRDASPVELDVNGALTATVGPNGLSADDLAAVALALDPARRRVADAAPGFLDFPRRREELLEVQTLTNGLLGRYDTVVVFGAGASAVGARVLGAVRPTGRIRRPGLVVADSIDPHVMGDLLQRLDLRRTLFNVVSQSGDAAETMAQFVIVRDRLLRELGAVDYREHVVVTTDPERGSLRQIVNDEGFRALAIPGDVQGAFGLLTSVGLFPAAMTGVDVEQVLEGAATMADRCAAAPTAVQDPAALLAGVLWSLAARHGTRGLAVVPYSAALGTFAEWASQLWTDSVSTIRHTELVRHYDGGGFSGRVLLLLRPRAYAGELQVPVAYQDLSDVGYLGGHALADILTAEGDAAAFLLARHGRPSVEVGVPLLSPGAFGQVIHLFQRASAVLAALEDRDPGQIADADEARRALGSLLGRSGTDAEAGELAAWRARKDLRYIL
jgi:glucose-6-phosphate isomerase